jgi:hypothetical protein
VESVSAEQLKRFIEAQHGGTGTLLQSVRIKDTQRSQGAWDGVVHVFELKGHPKARRAYAWSSPVSGTAKPRLFAVLHMGAVTGPIQAVKAASAAIHKWGARGSRR